MRSSYLQHNYGELLKDEVIKKNPDTLVELGILDGYSTLHLALGLKELCSEVAVLDAYDLFFDYAFKHGNKDEVEEMLFQEGVSDYVNVIKGDAYEVHEGYLDSSIDLIHIDISNTGQVLFDMMHLWNRKIKYGGVILFEGGSAERDQVDWMVKYNKPSIAEELKKNQIIKEQYTYKVYEKFPSITVLTKKAEFVDGVGW